MKVLSRLLIPGAIALISAGGVQADAISTDDVALSNEITGPAAQSVTNGSMPVAGMTIFIDEETGNFRAPTAEEAALFSAELQKVFSSAEDAAAPQEVFSPAEGAAAPQAARASANGIKRVNLGLSQLQFSTVTIGSDGKVNQECNHDVDKAMAHIHNHVATAEEK